MGNANKFFGAGQRRAQTRLKHAILESYLAAFAGKTGSKSPGGNVGFLDGYAGPGSDTNKATGVVVDGSPRIALRVARHLGFINPPKTLHCVFVEASRKNFTQLKALLESAPGVDTLALHGKITAHVEEAMARFDGMPALVFLDPYGVGLDQVNVLRTVLGRPGNQPTELMLNFSLEAVRRAGPFVKKPEGFPRRAGLLKTMDTWLGGDWWQPIMLDTDPDDEDAVDRAANDIAGGYAERLAKAAGCDVFTVPMRRSATHKALFSLILFHPRAYAKYPYNEAVSLAQKEWRETMRGIEIERAERELEKDPSRGSAHVEDARQLTKLEEVQLELDWVDTIYDNLKHAILKRGSVSMKNDFDLIFDGVRGLARGTHFRKAWDRLADEELVEMCRPHTKYEWAVIVRKVGASGVTFRGNQSVVKEE